MKSAAGAVTDSAALESLSGQRSRSKEMTVSQDLQQWDCYPPEAPLVWSPATADVYTPLSSLSSKAFL